MLYALSRGGVVPRLSTQPAPLGLFARAFKRIVDVAGATLALLITAPVLLTTMALIRIDSRGPALFRQVRVGRRGRRFEILKLRTMSIDGDDTAHREYVASLIRGDADQRCGMFKLADDPRVTRVGRILRRFSIDELPQLWNVLRGDMSLVGPRPAIPDEVALFDERARRRLLVKPGVTGAWQVGGRCLLTFDEMIDLDVGYFEEWTPWSDLSILARTPLVVASRKGAA